MAAESFWLSKLRKKVLDSDDVKAIAKMYKFQKTGKLYRSDTPKKVQRLIDAQNYIDFRKW